MKTLLPKTLFLASLASLAFSAAVASAAVPNVIQNGSFESSFSDWTHSGVLEIGSGFFWATDGSHSVVFNGYDNVGDATLSQSFPTVPGVRYDLTFDYGVFGGSPPQSQPLQVLVTGLGSLLNQTALATGNVPVSFSTRSYSFTADSTNTTLTFKDLTTLTESMNNDSVLDNVKVTRQDLRASIRVSFVDICWAGTSNWLYQVQYTSDLTSTQWFNLGAPIVGNGLNCVTDPVTAVEHRFYRIVDAQ